MLADLRDGREDPEDAYEFLGTDKIDATMGKCEPKLPMMLYLGFGHSGSTSLSEQLNMHPQISYGNVKEHHHWHWERHSGNLTKKEIKRYASEFRKAPCHKTFVFDGTIANIYK